MNKFFVRRKYMKVKSAYDYCIQNNIKSYSKENGTDKFLNKCLKKLRADLLTFNPNSTSLYEECEPTDSVLTFIDHGNWPFGHYSKLIFNFSQSDTLYNNCTAKPDYNFYRVKPRLYLIKKKY